MKRNVVTRETANKLKAAGFQGVLMWHYSEGMIPPDELFFTQSSGLMQFDIVAPTAQEVADQFPTRLAICCHCGHTKRKVWRSGDRIYLVQASPPVAVTMHRSGTFSPAPGLKVSCWRGGLAVERREPVSRSEARRRTVQTPSRCAAQRSGPNTS